jgi:hypothetical protein
VRIGTRRELIRETERKGDVQMVNDAGTMRWCVVDMIYLGDCVAILHVVRHWVQFRWPVHSVCRGKSPGSRRVQGAYSIQRDRPLEMLNLCALKLRMWITCTRIFVALEYSRFVQLGRCEASYSISCRVTGALETH